MWTGGHRTSCPALQRTALLLICFLFRVVYLIIYYRDWPTQMPKTRVGSINKRSGLGQDWGRPEASCFYSVPTHHHHPEMQTQGCQVWLCLALSLPLFFPMKPAIQISMWISQCLNVATKSNSKLFFFSLSIRDAFSIHALILYYIPFLGNLTHSHCFSNQLQADKNKFAFLNPSLKASRTRYLITGWHWQITISHALQSEIVNMKLIIFPNHVLFLII